MYQLRSKTFCIRTLTYVVLLTFFMSRHVKLVHGIKGGFTQFKFKLISMIIKQSKETPPIFNGRGRHLSNSEISIIFFRIGKIFNIANNVMLERHYPKQKTLLCCLMPMCPPGSRKCELVNNIGCTCIFCSMHETITT